VNSVLLLAIGTVILFGFSISPRDASGLRPLICAHNVVMGAFAAYVLMPGIVILLHNGDYVWASRYATPELLTRTLGCFLLAIILFLTGTFLHRARGANATPTGAPTHDASGSSWKLPLALIVLGLCMKVYVTIQLGGIGPMVAGLSTGIRNYLDLAPANAVLVGWRTLSGIADGAATWLIVEALRLRRRILSASIIFAVVIVATYLTIGKRLILLLPLLAVAIAVHKYRRPILVRAAPLAAAIVAAVGMASLFFRIFLPAAIAHIRIDLNKVPWAHGSYLYFYLRSPEFSTVEMMSVALQSRSRLIGMFGGPWQTFYTTNLEPFLYGIPRVIFPWKPHAFYDLSQAISALILGTNVGDANVGYASTFVGTSYIVGGLVLMVLASVAFGWLASALDRTQLTPSRDASSAIWYAVGLAVTFQLFRQGTLGWTFIVTIVQQYGFILAVLLIAVSRSLAMRAGARYATSVGGNVSR
jgi:hypothetical protein